MVRGFRIEPMVIINKFDLNERVARQIEKFCLEDNLNLIGKIPFNKIMVDALIQQQTIIEYAPDSDVAVYIKDIWNQIINA
jgi:MinD superfamily P-loop ATPase